MRTLTTMILALLLACVTTSASAQDATQPATEHNPSATIELQARIGGGETWASPTDGVNPIPALESGSAGNMNFGATLSVRHYGSGFGLTGGYTHVFTGVLDHFGLHEFDARLSERLSLVRRGHFETSLLIEVGGVYATGGGSTSCAFNFSESGCSERALDATLAGGIGVLGVQFRYSALLAGLEVDYRHLTGIGASQVRQDEELLVMARIGVAFDL